MKFPNHIILDFNTPKVSYHEYWLFKYIWNFENKIYSYNHTAAYRRFLMHAHWNFLKPYQYKPRKFRLRSSLANPATFANSKVIDYALKIYGTLPKIKHTVNYSDSFQNVIHHYYANTKDKFDMKLLFVLFKKFDKYLKNVTLNINKDNDPKNDILWELFDINFLKKEKLYTKLKYSRVPQYDIVSGGSAALLSGFLGFLICEKFGFELLDSGDFYILFMYTVFMVLALKPLLQFVSRKQLFWGAFSYKWFFLFYKELILVFFFNIKNFIKF